MGGRVYIYFNKGKMARRRENEDEKTRKEEETEKEEENKFILPNRRVCLFMNLAVFDFLLN